MDKKVIELFAGVGGFRVGLNKVKNIDENGKAIENGKFSFVWSNQWEPSTTTQHAFDCYQTRFGVSAKENSNEDIGKVDKSNIPDHALLCGGFPCQDYSVARSLSKEKGIEGKKGVLWWQINEILTKKKTPFVLLENVDRLVKSPSKQRGRDFGIMLRCFADLGYAVEWRIINAAEYGHPQRRRRIYIFAYKSCTNYFKAMKKVSPNNIIYKQGVFAKEFPIEEADKKIIPIDIVEGYTDLIKVSNDFKAAFENSGYMINGKVHTVKTFPVKCKSMTLNDIVLRNNIDNFLYLNDSQISKFAYLRGSKKIPRTRPDGTEYNYSEGSMSPIDSLSLSGRTMLTSEGSINRSTHIIEDVVTGKKRLLSPIECERLNQFPDNWTNTMPYKKRYFMMGNALVCGVIEKIGNEISRIIDNEK